MKHLRYLLIFTLLLFADSLSAQGEHPYVKNLRAKMVGDQVFVSWTTKAGFTCQDIEIQLGLSDTSFQTANIYYGICGDTTERDYNILLDSPYFNQTNYLRLDLGAFGYSDVINFFALYIEGSSVFPNPIRQNSVLRVNNSNFQTLDLIIYNHQGRKIIEQTFEEESIALWPMGLEGGWYYYLLYREEELISKGKFIR